MDAILGLLRIKVRRGINLAIRDAGSASSDPYVVITMGSQKTKTRVIKKNCNPEWNDILTLSITDPNIPIKLRVYDHDTFTKHDRMGDATIDIKPYIECMKMGLEELPIGTSVTKVQPNDNNCLADESKVVWIDKGKMIQDMLLKLQHVEKGKIQIQLEWFNPPGCKGLQSS
ncbi:unnamed protein product [Amaranthus hypochondriacus]